MGRNRQRQPATPVITRRNTDWTEKRILRMIKMTQSEDKQLNQFPIEKKQIKYNRIFTKQSDGSFKLTAYKCNYCDKLFGDERLLVTHPYLCKEIINKQ